MDFSGEVKRNDEAPPAVGVNQEEIMQINGRWSPVGVLSIKNVRPVNMEVFEDDEQAFVGGRVERSNGAQTRRGMLKSANLQVVFALQRRIPVDQLLINVEETMEPQSKVTRVIVGCSGLTPQDYPILESTYVISIPIHRGLSSTVPLLDEIHTRKQHLIHHTVNVLGENPDNSKSSHYIRLKIDEKAAAIHLVSVSTSMVDVARVREACSNGRDFVNAWCKYLVSIPLQCISKRKPEGNSEKEARSDSETTPSDTPSSKSVEVEPTVYKAGYQPVPTYVVEGNATAEHAPRPVPIAYPVLGLPSQTMTQQHCYMVKQPVPQQHSSDAEERQ